MRVRQALLCCLLLVVSLLGLAIPETSIAQEDSDNGAEIKRRIAFWRENHPQYTKGIDFTGQASAASAGTGTAKGMSLHIGLNGVDPDYYEGWSGILEACESDAEAMANIANSKGFKPVILRTKEAKYDSVFGEIRRAAASLNAGDIFLLTYSGHGGQVPDENGDEDDGLDETWCLYDREVIDDELAQLFSEFKAGVRVLVIADSCHSGSSIKFKDYAQITALKSPSRGRAPDQLKKKFENLLAQKTFKEKLPSPVRAIPAEVQERVLKKHKSYYTARGKEVPNEKVSLRNTTASVLLLAACKDKQLSLELSDPRHGLFTATLLAVWDGGKFVGGYREFLQRIDDDMPDYQVPNYFPMGAPNPAFEAEKPFTVSK